MRWPFIIFLIYAVKFHLWNGGETKQTSFSIGSPACPFGGLGCFLWDSPWRIGWPAGGLTENLSQTYKCWSPGGNTRQRVRSWEFLSPDQLTCSVIPSKSFYFPMPGFSQVWTEGIGLDKWFSNDMPSIPKTHYKCVSELLYTEK